MHEDANAKYTIYYEYYNIKILSLSVINSRRHNSIELLQKISDICYYGKYWS